MVTRRTLIAASWLLIPSRRARAQTRAVLRIGVLTDLSGPYKDIAGQGSTPFADPGNLPSGDELAAELERYLRDQ